MNANSKTQNKLPLAYEKGYQDFYGRDFKVTKNTLIPRPETEQLIDAVLNLAGKPYLPGVKPSKPKLEKNLKILDVGTGSGCIAITLKKELPDAEVYASDISEAALSVAKENIKNHETPINIIISNLLEKVNFTPNLVVANLPYVDKTWTWLDPEALSYEPSVALYAENHGLALIFKLLEQSSSLEVPYLVLEADPCQHIDIINFAKTKNYKLLETRGYALVFTYCNPLK